MLGVYLALEKLLSIVRKLCLGGVSQKKDNLHPTPATAIYLPSHTRSARHKQVGWAFQSGATSSISAEDQLELEEKPMSVPNVSLRLLIEAGAHFGHTPRRWNPKMEKYIFGVRNGVHILDLEQSVPLFRNAIDFLSETASKGGRFLFVGTKPQAAPAVRAAAEQSAQYYVNHRWLGGMLTNWTSVSASLKLLQELNERLETSADELVKKEQVRMIRKRDKLEKALGGIVGMGGIPDALIVIDTNRESIAIAEAKRLSIPIVAPVDSNSDPDDIDYPIPANDDATRAIQLYLDLISQAILDGVGKHLQTVAQAEGQDLGAAAEVSATSAIAGSEMAGSEMASAEVSATETSATETSATETPTTETQATETQATETPTTEAQATEAQVAEPETTPDTAEPTAHTTTPTTVESV